jgi:hypothetical protein
MSLLSCKEISLDVCPRILDTPCIANVKLKKNTNILVIRERFWTLTSYKHVICVEEASPCGIGNQRLIKLRGRVARVSAHRGHIEQSTLLRTQTGLPHKAVRVSFDPPLIKLCYHVSFAARQNVYSGTSVHELNPFLGAVREPKCS